MRLHLQAGELVASLKRQLGEELQEPANISVLRAHDSYWLRMHMCVRVKVSTHVCKYACVHNRLISASCTHTTAMGYVCVCAFLIAFIMCIYV